MPITALDGLVILVTLLSAFLAMVRGFSREVLSLLSWVLAAVIAYFLYDKVLPFVAPHISHEIVAIAVTLAGIFLISLLIISAITMKLADIIIDSRIGALDRSLGFIFGMIRGILILAVAILFLNHLNISDQRSWIANAKTKPMLDSISNRVWEALPKNLLEKAMTPLRKKNRSEADSATQADTAPPAE